MIENPFEEAFTSPVSIVRRRGRPPGSKNKTEKALCEPVVNSWKPKSIEEACSTFTTRGITTRLDDAAVIIDICTTTFLTKDISFDNIEKEYELAWKARILVGHFLAMFTGVNTIEKDVLRVWYDNLIVRIDMLANLRGV